MRFVLLYPNHTEIRKAVEEQVLDAVKKGMEFDLRPFRNRLFMAVPRWPSSRELFSLPPHLQCEEVEIKKNKLISLRCLVIDAEIISKVDVELSK